MVVGAVVIVVIVVVIIVVSIQIALKQIALAVAVVEDESRGEGTGGRGRRRTRRSLSEAFEIRQTAGQGRVCRDACFKRLEVDLAHAGEVEFVSLTHQEMVFRHECPVAAATILRAVPRERRRGHHDLPRQGLIRVEETPFAAHKVSAVVVVE